MLIATSALSWWAVGFLLSGGNVTTSSFLGQSDGATTNAFLKDVDKTGGNLIGWFFGFAFAATAATIVSGAVAERVHFRAYLAYSVVVTSVIYPIVAYWGWASTGWLKAAGNDKDPNNGYVDFAGSGIVHMVGGCAGLVGAILVGPRKFLDSEVEGDYVPRFDEDGTVNFPVMVTSSQAFSALGTLILWVGWFGFNPGSQLAFAGANSNSVGLALVNTTLCPAAAAVTYFLLSYMFAEPELGGILNSTLGGLVAITANCNFVEPWAAVVIGFVAAWVYLGSSYMLKYFQVDDVIDAPPVHYFCGMWGVLATGLFMSDALCAPHKAGLFYGGGGTVLGWQICGIVAITAWTGILTALVLGPMHYLGCLRLTEEEEKMGLDRTMSHRGVQALTVPASPKSKQSQLNTAPAEMSLESVAPTAGIVVVTEGEGDAAEGGEKPRGCGSEEG